MITQTALRQTEIQGEIAIRQNRRVKGAQKWRILEASSVTRSAVVNPNQRPSELATRRPPYGPSDRETAGAQRLTGILVLPYLSIVVGFLLTATIVNSARGGNLETFAILAVAMVAAIVGFFHVLQAARALDELEYATHASIVRNGKVNLISRRQTTDDEPNRQR